jgi:hypothetical protein
MILEQRYSLFGYSFSFRTNVPRAAELFSRLYAGKADSRREAAGNLYQLLHCPGAAADEQWQIEVPGLALHAKPTLGDCLYTIEGSISGDLTRYDHGLHFVHGAVVYAEQGDILLTGNSGAGKTTLSLALAARGLRVGCDDIAVLNPVDGLLQPHVRCFHIDARSAELLAGLGLELPADALRDQFVTLRDLGMPEPAPARPRFIFLLEPERRPVPLIVPETQAQAASALLMQTGRGRFSDLDGVRAIARLTGAARCFRLWSGDPASTASAVLELCAKPSRDKI